MDIRLFYEYAVLARTLNYHDAAEQLQISQSTLSRHIVELENYYKVQFFRRDKYHVDLTDEGAEFYDSALAIWRAFEDSERVVKGFASSDQALTIGGVLTTNLFMGSVSEAERTVRASNPHFSVKLSSHTSPSLKEQVELLHTGEITCASVYDGRRIDKDVTDVVVDHLYDIPTEVIVPTSHPLANRNDSDVAHMSELVGNRFIQLVSPQFTPIWKSIRSQMDEKGCAYTVHPVSVSSTYDIFVALRALDNRTVFVAYRGLTASFVRSYGLDMTGLRAIPIPSHELSLGLDLLHLRNKRPTSLGLFVDALHDAMARQFPTVPEDGAVEPENGEADTTAATTDPTRLA